ncbi:hypothetical protein G5V57_02905 [Nordella sp. HKS 07]|uniref:hypothetical protein n=1 Tax=Nordella sp. HKS 07 TaxID=2712222 RepID=UPI0013E1CFDB|nr:hypothetical protein [Nordella sp. HKS 07]QIG46792.1 hypothetical protein G5V57_02905 [Nordella sp. HKS 07]
MQRLAAVFGFRLNGGNFPGDLVRNRRGFAPGYFGIEFDAAEGLAAREGSGARP